MAEMLHATRAVFDIARRRKGAKAMTEGAQDLLNRWLQLKRDYDAEVAQYLTTWVGDEPTRPPQKVLTLEALERIKALAEEVERAHEDWMAAARGEGRKSA